MFCIVGLLSNAVSPSIVATGRPWANRENREWESGFLRIQRTSNVGSAPDRLGQELDCNHPEHRSGREPQTKGEERLEGFDEQEGRHGHQRLRKAREDAQPRGTADGHASWNEYEADRETLRYVVNGHRGRDREPEALPSPERDSDTDTLGEGMDRHDADDQQHLPSIRSGNGAEMAFAIVPEQASQRSDEQHAPSDPCYRRDMPGSPSLPDQTDACRGHQQSREGVGECEPGTRRPAPEEERKRPDSSGQCGRQRREKDGADAHLAPPKLANRKRPHPEPEQHERPETALGEVVIAT
jgi:hypothetical protein